MGSSLRTRHHSQAHKETALELLFYQQDVLEVAKNLLGKSLFTKIDGHLTGGVITEVEAYAGVLDKASHSYGNRRTKRNETMYGPGGIAYVYLCYGIHHLLNAVTNIEGIPQAVLIRALHPTVGIETMLKRRGKKTLDKTLTSGPGALTKALGIDLSQNGRPLNSSELWIEKTGVKLKTIETTPRIGVDYAGDDAILPYRFVTQIV